MLRVRIKVVFHFVLGQSVLLFAHELDVRGNPGVPDIVGGVLDLGADVVPDAGEPMERNYENKQHFHPDHREFGVLINCQELAQLEES